MKRTVITVAVIVTTGITWMALALIGCLLSEATFKECMTHGATIMIMFIVGWIPSVIVGIDMYEKAWPNE